MYLKPKFPCSSYFRYKECDMTLKLSAYYFVSRQCMCYIWYAPTTRQATGSMPHSALIANSYTLHNQPFNVVQETINHMKHVNTVYFAGRIFFYQWDRASSSSRIHVHTELQTILSRTPLDG